MKRIALLLGTVALLTVSCSTSKVAYQDARNYFVNSNAPKTTTKITTQQEFARVFGMATTMGETGRPTQIDFHRQMAIPIILPVTNRSTIIDIVSAKKEDRGVVVRYRLHVGEERSYTIRPFRILLIDRKYASEPVVLEEVE
jgi:hypothetical protein